MAIKVATLHFKIRTNTQMLITLEQGLAIP
jgi:hypothetical protein